MGGTSTNGAGWNAPPPSYSARSTTSGTKSPTSRNSPVTTTAVTTQATSTSASTPTPTPDKTDFVFSPMPSRIPDAGWASWGTDPSKIKKEEEQVVRPPPRTFAQTALSSSGSAVTAVKASSILSGTGNGPAPRNVNGQPRPSVASPPPQQNHKHVEQNAQAYSNNGNGGGNGRNYNAGLPGRTNTNGSGSNNGWNPSAQARDFQVRLPGHQQQSHFQQQQQQRQQNRQYPSNTYNAQGNHGHQPPPVTSSLSIVPHQIPNMRPPPPPVTYTTRPTFQYGQVTIATPTPTSTPPVAPIKAIVPEVATSTAQKDTPPPLARAEETLEKTRNAHSHPRPPSTVVKSPKTSKVTDSAPSPHWKNIVQQSGINEVATHIKNNGNANGVRTPTSPTRSHKRKTSKSKSKTSRLESGASDPVSPTLAEGPLANGTSSSTSPVLPAGQGWDTPVVPAVTDQGWDTPVVVNLSQSTGADSGHASFSSNGTPSTVQLSSAPSTGPKVHLPSATTTIPVSSTTRMEEVPQSTVSSMEAPPATSCAPQAPTPLKPTSFKLHIPKSVTLPAALKALDLDNLEFLAGDRMTIDPDFLTRSITFELKTLDDPAARKRCVMVVEAAASALREICGSEQYEVVDEITKAFLAGDVPSKTLQPRKCSDHVTLPKENDGQATQLVHVDVKQKIELSSALNSKPDDEQWKISSSAGQQHDQVEPSPGQALLTLLHDAAARRAETSGAITSNKEVVGDSTADGPPHIIAPARDTTPIANPLHSIRDKQDTPNEARSSVSEIPEIATVIETPTESAWLPRCSTSGFESEVQRKLSDADSHKHVESIHPKAVSQVAEVEIPPWIRKSTRFPELFELALPMPHAIFHNTLKHSKILDHIALQDAHYSRGREVYYLRSKIVRELLRARTVLAVLITSKEPSFNPSEPILALEADSAGHRVIAELLQDKMTHLRTGRADHLTAYIAHSLFEEASRRQTISSENENRMDVVGMQDNVCPDGIAQPAINREIEITQSLPQSAEPSAGSENDIPATALAAPPLDPEEKQTACTDSSLSVQQSTQNDMIGLTRSNSVCWFLPNSPARGRFFGTSCKYMKEIQRITGVRRLFWKSAPQEDGLFLFIIASDKKEATKAEWLAMADAYRLVKGWAIASNADEMLPTVEDAWHLSCDPSFRLNVFELKMSLNLSSGRRADMTETRRNECTEAAFHSLLQVYNRPRQANSGNPPFDLYCVRFGAICEVATPHNSLCWPAQGLETVYEFRGEKYAHMNAIQKITGVAAFQIDINERRYGSGRSYVYLVASKDIRPTAEEAEQLASAFRLISAVAKLSGLSSILPPADVLERFSLAPAVLGRSHLDEPLLAAIQEGFEGTGLCIEAIRQVYQHLMQGASSPGTVQTAVKVLTQASSKASVIAHVDQAPGQSHLDGLEKAMFEDYEEGLPFVEYRSLRDIPSFALSGVTPVDDGYLDVSEEQDLFEDISEQWSRLSHQTRMQLIGSAEWATVRVKVLHPKLQSGFNDGESIGPSASQFGASTEDEKGSQGGIGDPNKPHDTSGWQAAHDQVEAEDAVLPRVQDWAQQVAHDAQSQHKPQPQPLQPTSHLAPGVPRSSQSFEMKQPMITLPFPNDRVLRKSILGENNELLQKVAFHTGAVVQLEPQVPHKPDNERLVCVGGKYECIARASQMLAVAVKTHVDNWRFPPEVEAMIRGLNQDAKNAERERLLSSGQEPKARWTIEHTTFIPKATISLVETAVKDNVFLTDCATVNIDPTVIGHVRIDAPTCNQSDAALIKLCDIVRKVEPAWMPSGEDGKKVIEEADAHSGPGLAGVHAVPQDDTTATAAAQEELFRTAGGHWRPPSNKIAKQNYSHARQISQQTA